MHEAYNKMENQPIIKFYYCFIQHYQSFVSKIYFTKFINQINNKKLLFYSLSMLKIYKLFWNITFKI